MNERNANNIKKRQMYYSRPYRHLTNNLYGKFIYLLLLVLPSFIGLLLYYDEISVIMCRITYKALKLLLPELWIYSRSVEFIPFLGSLSTLVLPTSIPSFGFTLSNLIASFFIIFLCLRGKAKNRPFSIFLSIMLFIHIINCSFFLFAADQFPYDLREYSGLYMQQQAGIWIAFLLMGGLVTGFLGRRCLLLRINTFFFIMLYSFGFGLLRYILALYIVCRFSVIYIALFFFALGPFFDFLYFVGIYGVFLDKMTANSQKGKNMEDWKWS